MTESPTAGLDYTFWPRLAALRLGIPEASLTPEQIRQVKSEIRCMPMLGHKAKAGAQP